VEGRLAAVLVALLAGLAAACSAVPSRDAVLGGTGTDPEALELAYASDYFSFVGRDGQGAVAFALDTNRGRDGDAWQAEHFVVLHDAGTGWQPVAGNGAYPNPGHALTALPDSPAFTFSGTPARGLRIRAKGDGPDLAVGPETPYIERRMGLAVYRIGSAPATLRWAGREVPGRVIHEYLFLPGFNRLSRKYPGLFGGFTGIYAVVGGEGDGPGDLYLHHHPGGAGFMAELAGRDAGFLVLDGVGAPLAGLQVRVTGSRFAPGLYRWPERWTATFTTGEREWTLHLAAADPNRVANWVIGGFSMVIVTGTLEGGGVRLPVLGLGELIM
jgi:hypothetical protein